MRRDPDRVRYYRDNFHPNDGERWETSQAPPQGGVRRTMPEARRGERCRMAADAGNISCLLASERCVHAGAQRMAGVSRMVLDGGIRSDLHHAEARV